MNEPEKTDSDELKPMENRLIRPTTNRLVPKKCCLKPGHSLMDWIRLGNSDTDLSGMGGNLKSVGAKELATHNTQKSAWIALRGKVYNVTHYLDFHPGGKDELMRGIGSDATKLFDEVHCWVNHHQLLYKCLVGPYEGRTLKLNDEMMKIFKNSKTKSPLQLIKTPSLTNMLADGLNIGRDLSDIINFDWTQSTCDIVFYYYTRKFCNPGLMIEDKCGNNIQITVFIEQTMYIFNYKLYEPIKWPPINLKVSSETGKIEFSFKKRIARLWPVYGTKTNEKATTIYGELKIDYLIEENESINNNSFQLTLKPQSNKAVIVIPVGCHMHISTVINEETISRSYTPIPYKYMKNKENDSTRSLLHLVFLIKSYATGLLSHHLKHLHNNSSLKLSQPKGNLKLFPLLSYNHFLLLAAGSGLTPMLALIDHLLQRSSNRTEKVLVMYFNNTEEDIWCKDALYNTQIEDERCEIINILSKPSASWEGYIGHISAELMTSIIKKYKMESSFVLICGPTGFVSKAVDILMDMRFLEKNLFIFQD